MDLDEWLEQSLLPVLGRKTESDTVQRESDVLQRLNEDVRSYIVAKMDTSEVAALTEGWDVDDI